MRFYGEREASVRREGRGCEGKKRGRGEGRGGVKRRRARERGEGDFSEGGGGGKRGGIVERERGKGGEN